MQETVLPRSSGESLKWVPKVQGRCYSAESLRQKDRDRHSLATTTTVNVFNILFFRATDTVGDFLFLFKYSKKERAKRKCRNSYSK